MAAPSFRRNPKGVAEVLRGDWIASQVNDAAESTAAEAREIAGEGVPIDVSEYTTDRRAASVTIADATGVELQARDGVLTRAAAAVGLDVNAR